MKNFIYKFDNQKAIFYPQHGLIAVSIVFYIIFSFFILTTGSALGIEPIFMMIIIGVFTLIMILAMSIARYTQIIIDLESGKVIKKIFLTEKEIASFGDIRSVELIKDVKSTYIEEFRYVLNINKAPYVIPLTHSLRKGAKNLQVYKNDVIPIIQQVLANMPANPTEETSPLNQSYSFEYFQPSRRDCYRYSQKDLSYLLIIVMLVGLSLFMKMPLSISGISFFAFAIFLYLYGKRIDVDVYNLTITTSFWDIFSRERYSFDDILSIEQGTAVAVIGNGAINGKATIAIKLRHKGTVKNVAIHSDRNQEKIIGIVRELNLLTEIEKKHE